MNREFLKGVLWGILGVGIFFFLAGLLTGPAQAGEQEEAPKVALTFDDGPTIYTETLLEGLKERGIRASFFLLGRNIPGQEAVIREMYADGHLIGNHTYNHVQLTRLSKDEAREEIEKTSGLIYEITGQYPIFVRPPYGEWRKDLEYAVTMLPVFWSIDPRDWNTQDTDAVVRNVEKKVEDGSIILLHDSSESSVKAALRIADDLAGKGYQFVTAEEMLLD